MTSQETRDFDLVLFGATSFVGKTTAAYLIEQHPQLRIAFAGRDEHKLQALCKDIGADSIPLIIADATDKPKLDELTARTKVVISTVGPYTRYGDMLVDACAEHNTHYVDLCGEALFIRRIIDCWHGRTNAKIVPSCGFDSVPSDMGLFHLHQKSGKQFDAVTMAVEDLRGGLSGGTVDSMREVSADAKRMPHGGAILHSPYSLSPDHKQEPDLGPQPDFEVHFDQLIRQWTGPFFMAMFNTRVVRRSNTLQDYAYGSHLRYREVMPTGTGLAGMLKARALDTAVKLGFAAVMTDSLRKPLKAIFPVAGEGPKDINKGGFSITHYGRATDGSLHSARVQAEGDPGYKVTAMMLAEAAVLLAAHPEDLPQRSGVLTPATALGSAYVEALHRNGMRFS
ncbi:saccharopine dehydrogenase family protein [Corynebacterium epidermidicanis]|uniref:Saccharopine dehydrogenase NADP binding domain-containing protein n=1 Tax=Corynebacterium epidermidicanis TaxID=1050174 RepID=A0A0G3GPC2_9CORY|nr:saccharopine dehydrogenase NADP-binding domain-containing protein [Corynebacterium epidermidicanis]AKK02420.1 hypothetical protein CEPID_02700 [Corynebacterium epidermidicanis]